MRTLWANAKDLRAGSVLYISTNTRVEIAAIMKRIAITREHNLTVGAFHFMGKSGKFDAIGCIQVGLRGHRHDGASRGKIDEVMSICGGIGGKAQLRPIIISGSKILN